MNLYPEMNAKIVGILRISDRPDQLYAADLIESLQTRLEESKKGSEEDREQFRHGVDAWQKRIRKAVKRIWGLRAKSASDKDCIAFVESDAVYARGEWRKAEGTIRKAEEQVILLLEQVGSLRGKLADAEKRARDNGDQAAAHLEDLEGLRRKTQLHKEAKWDAEKRLASVEVEATHYKDLLKLAAPILDAVDDAAKRVRFTELHGISSLE